MKKTERFFFGAVLAAMIFALVAVGITIAGSTTSVVGTQIANTLVLGDGTAGAPSLSFSSDNDGTGTGIYRSTTNEVGFSANGTGRAFVQANGYLRLTAGAFGQTTDTADLGASSFDFRELFLDRAIKGMKTKTVTDNSATTVAVLTLSQTNLQNFADAEVQWGCYYRDDGPAVQMFRNQSHLAAVNNAGTVACTVSSLSGTSAVTAGSLIGTLAVTTGTDVCNVRITCDSNLAGANPAFFAAYRFDMLGPYATITPQ